MSRTALRFLVISGLAFFLVVGLGIMPALAMHSASSSAGASVASGPARLPDAAVTANYSDTERDQEVEFAGTIQSIAGNVWTVNGITFTVDISTQIQPSSTLAVVGAFVKVQGIKQPDGTILAREIEVVTKQPEEDDKRVEFRGPIDSFSATVWVVAGKTVNITTTTVIHGTPVVSATAEVQAIRKSDGSLWAVQIEVQKPEVEQERVEFKGVISAFSSTQWTVGGKTVLISTTTQISGTPQVGLIAEVQAIKTGSTLTALFIRVVQPEPQDIDFDGKITSINGNMWVVGGKTVIVDANTMIDQSGGKAKVGAQAEIKGVLQLGGSVLAGRIRIGR